jgi:hypothetical protein
MTKDLHDIAEQLAQLTTNNLPSSETINRVLGLLIDGAKYERDNTFEDHNGYFDRAIKWAEMPVTKFKELVDKHGYEKVYKKSKAWNEKGDVIHLIGKSIIYPEGTLIFPQMNTVITWKFKQLDAYNYANNEGKPGIPRTLKNKTTKQEYECPVCGTKSKTKYCSGACMQEAGLIKE